MCFQNEKLALAFSYQKTRGAQAQRFIDHLKLPLAGPLAQARVERIAR